jgi:hypothetical protein
MAFSASDLAGTVHESGVWQLFCFDPNGARVELDLEAG